MVEFICGCLGVFFVGLSLLKVQRSLLNIVYCAFFLVACSGGSDSSNGSNGQAYLSGSNQVPFEESPAIARSFDISSYQDKKMSSSDVDNLDGTWLYVQTADYYYRDIGYHPEGEQRHFIQNLRVIISIKGDTAYFFDQVIVEETPVFRFGDTVSFSFGNRLTFQGQLINGTELRGNVVNKGNFNTEIDLLRSSAGMIKLSEANIFSPLELLPSFGNTTVETSADNGSSETAAVHLFVEASSIWSWVENGVETATNHIYSLQTANIFENVVGESNFFVESHKGLRLTLQTKIETEEDEQPGWYLRVTHFLSPNFWAYEYDSTVSLIERSDENGVTGAFVGLSEFEDSVNVFFDLEI